MAQTLVFTNNVYDTVDTIVDSLKPASVFVLTDDNTFQSVWPLLLSQSKSLKDAKVITIQPDDTHKDIDSASHIWKQLSDQGATRDSLIFNVGGGMVTDIGGFAASTFKRGVRFVNIPTTLLAAVDASVGGKTGINFNGLKNEIGVFSDAYAVIISTVFLHTLPDQEIMSGYAEMLKHGLIDDNATLQALLNYDPLGTDSDDNTLLDLIEHSIGIKKDIVQQDPREGGIRKSLNLGHTVGHAFESMAMKRATPIPHGYAVAWGLVVELILSNMQLGFPSQLMYEFANYVKEKYGAYTLSCDDYPEYIELMRHDKKNTDADHINFTLLGNVGDVHINCTCTSADITAAFDIYRDIFD